MYAMNFEYDGKYLADFGFIICVFDGTSGAETIDSGAKLSFNTVPMHRGKKHSLVSSQYEDCITSTFSICKDPDKYNQKEMEITSEEFRALARWLNRPTFNRFCLLDNDIEYKKCYYDATFNLSRIEVAGTLCGIELEMVTNRPFGYGKEENIVLKFTSGDEPKVFRDMSDEIGYIYPKITITNVVGDLTLTNEINNTKICSMEIKGCSSGETITIDGDTLNINSTKEDINKRFNFDFFKIGNTMNTNENKITSSLPCTVIISYHPVIKRLL